MMESEINWLSSKAICSRLSIKPHTLARRIRLGQFPKPSKKHGTKNLWKESEFELWAVDNEVEKLTILDK